jgi:HEAT repeat protein
MKSKSQPSGASARSVAPRKWVLGLGLVLIVAAVVAAGMWVMRQPGAAVSEEEVVSSGAAPQQPAGSPSGSAPGAAVAVPANPFSQLGDKTLPLLARLKAARALARLGSDPALAALKAGLKEGPPELRGVIAEALGECPHAQARALLLELLNGSDAPAARGALRGLALRNDPDAASLIGQVLLDSDQQDSLRAEAAVALGDVRSPEALQRLERAATELQDDLLVESALQGLAKRPFAETEGFFRDYLGSDKVSADAKAEALEALAGTEGETSGLLLQYAANQDVQVRSAAISALSGAEGEMGPQVCALLHEESEPELRIELYQTLDNQSGYDPSKLLALVKSETDPNARLAALGVVADACQGKGEPALVEYFNQTAVPELQTRALRGENQPERIEAVNDLRLAGTPEALKALEAIVLRSSDPQVVQAASTPPVRAGD